MPHEFTTFTLVVPAVLTVLTERMGRSILFVNFRVLTCAPRLSQQEISNAEQAMKMERVKVMFAMHTMQARLSRQYAGAA